MNQRRGILSFFYPAGKVKSTCVGLNGDNPRVRNIFGVPRPKYIGAQALLYALIVYFIVFNINAARAETPLTIVDASLPSMVAGEQFMVRLKATGGAPPYGWSTDVALPDGIALSHDGVLSGRPVKSGPLTITIILADSGHPSHMVQKSFHATITPALALEWLDPPAVRNNRIDGSVRVSNGSHDEYDLTVVVEAVAENGRATAIGYQHFPLKPGTVNFPITFGNTLPDGAYVIHADAVAEVHARKNILRQRLQTPQPLRIITAP